MKRFAMITLMLVGVLTLGCYHATIVTGANPGATIIDKPWAHSFIFGLVSPSVVEVASQCPGGVAKVETEHSVPNWLVHVITFGIYTPIHIKVTCAGQAVSTSGEVEYLVPEADLVINEGSTQEEVIAAFQTAVDLSIETKEPVYVKFAVTQ